MNEPPVVAENLRVTAPGGSGVLLSNGTITLRPGRITAITGESGSGKTTLMRAVLGHLPPGARHDGGSIRVFGHDVLAMPEEDLRRLRRERLAFVGQDPGSALNPTMRVQALLREVAAGHDTSDPARVLARVQLPESVLSRRPGELSGGQQRRVALARALMRGVDVLLVDEPFAGLDARVRQEIVEVLRALATENGVAIAVSGHDTATLDLFADDHVVVGTPTTRVDLPRHAEKRWTTPAPVVLSGSALGLVRGGVPVLSAVDVALQRGTATAVVGESGAGKTTLARVLAGLEPAATGSLQLDGAGIGLQCSRRSRDARKRIQLVPQNPLSTLNPSRTVGETLERPLVRRRLRGGGARARQINTLLDSVRLPHSAAGRHPHELSGGQRQRVSIARALAYEPDVLICDEITSALDRTTARSIMDLLRTFMVERNTTLVVISHDLELVHHYCDSVLELDRGRMVDDCATPNFAEFES